MKSKKSILLLFLILNCFYSKAQGAFNTCGSEILEEFLLNHNPETQKNNAILENKYQDDLSKSNRSVNDSICLPIVVHLIHNGGLENITDTQIFQGIENLNDAFANKNYYNPNTGLDTKIQFCLARRDTIENEINGILRYTSIYTDMSISGSLDSILDLAYFDPSQYINLHIVQEACLGGNCGAVGFAGFNKIVVEAAYFGVSESKDAVVTHEMGHFLGLDHTFKGGCNNTNCLSDGDRVCDTPPDNQNFENCFSEHNSCTSDADDSSINNPFRPIILGGLGDQKDSHRNYMDYNSFECYDQFTQGQVDRMHWTIQNRYSSLLQSKACLSPCVNEAFALFTALTDSIEAGTTLNFINLSTNAISYVWTVDGDVFSVLENPTLMLNDVGTYLIELEVWNGDDTCLPHTFSIDIVVYCPIQSCIDYQVIGQYLYFENCASTQEENSWIIISGNNDTLFQSASVSLDSFYINNIFFVRLCLMTSNNYCQDYICEIIDIVSDGTEICNNEKDDDDDGLVDLFDPDCPCDIDAYQAQCEVDCQYIPEPSFDFGMEIKWKTQPFKGFLSNVVSYSNTSNQTILGLVDRPSNSPDGPALYTLDGMTGSILDMTSAPFNDSDWLAIARNDPSSEVNYFTFEEYGFKKFNSSLDLTTTSDLSSQDRSSPINFADFNGDGIAEVYIGNTIYNSITGKILIEDALVKGCSQGCRVQISVAGDFLPSPGLELAIGNVIYDIEINNPNGTSGNSMIAQFADFPIKDGFTSAGDIDGDGQLDVVVVKGTGGPNSDGIWVWNPRTLELIARAPADNSWGGIASIGDVDGDCLPEICMPFFEELRMYKYDGTKDLKLLYNLPTTDNSGSSGVTMFDFNHDGYNEVVYRDLSDLKIIEGSTGFTLSSIPLKSTTGYECPIITDVDNDGQAEILISGHESQWNKTILYCIKSSSDTWAPSRIVWNQYSYNPTFVNDDLTIPRYPQNPAKSLQGTENCLQETCNTPYNNFMVQATYRTQEGCFVWEDPECIGEICDNQKDDDDDGLVDLFDPDCPCSNEAYQAQCEVDCNYIPDPSFDFEMKIKWKSNKEVISTSNIVCYVSPNSESYIATSYTDLKLNSRPSYLRIFDGKTGLLRNEEYYGSNVYPSIAMGRQNASSDIEYYTLVDYGYKRFSSSLDLLETSELCNFNESAPISFADFNGDGISEIYFGNAIYNSNTGAVLIEDNLSLGCNGNCFRSFSIAGDFLPSPGLELAIGNAIYNIYISNVNGAIGNSMIAQFADSPISDGYTSAGDIDGDGELDVIVVNGNSNSDKGIWIWNPRTLKLIASAPINVEGGGVASLGDLDGDCLPEIAVIFDLELRVYKYNGSQDLELLYSLPVTDDSGITGITMFDLNQDGENEIIYRDETDLKIIEGKTGVTLSSIPMKSGTILEYPIIADIDQDGQAEILINGYETDLEESFMYCIESAGSPWAPARSLWNQYSYNPTMVNDDLTIPCYPQNPAKPLQGTENCLQGAACSTPYNNFMVQATNRTQAGCFVWPAIDLSLRLLDFKCNGDSLEIDLVINNDADFLSVDDTICINWYFDQMTPSNLLEISCLPIMLSTESSSDTLHFTIDLDGNSINQVLANITRLVGDNFIECNYLNNLDSVDINNSVPFLDLGPDINKCSSEVISFNVGTGFESYLWTDLTTDSIYSTSFAGTHFVELTDKCGNIFRDTVEIIFDTIDDIDLGLDLEICSQDSLQIIIPDDYDFVLWYPSDKVSCDTCFTTMISSNEIFELVVRVVKGNCVSLDSITIDIRTPEVVELAAQICQGDQYQYLDSIWTQEGLYSYQHPECDTVINISLNINLLDTSLIDRQICLGDSLFFNNTWLKDEGEYISILINQNDCDSMVVLNLLVQDQLMSNDSISICSGDSILYENQWISDLGVNEINSISTDGCDSTIYLALSYYQNYSMFDSIWLCPGDSIMFHNEWIYSDEAYVFDLITTEGCDSVINLRVNEYGTYSEIDSMWLCEGDSMSVQGNWIYEDFEYQEVFSSSQGCDSIYQYFILFEQLPDEPEFNFDCESSLIDLSVIAEDWEIVWDNGDMTSMTQYSGGQQVSVTLTSSNNCVITYEFDLPIIPNIELIPSFEDITLNMRDSLIFDLNLDLMEWNISWSPSDILSCDTCSLVIMYPEESTLVKLELEHLSGCKFEYSFLISLIETASDVYYIPNAFSPNKDNQNDVWQVFFNQGNGLRLSEGFIYDRWGNQVKSWENTSDISWDGKLNEKNVEQGVYIFFLKFIDHNGEEIEVYGDLTLLR